MRKTFLAAILAALGGSAAFGETFVIKNATIMSEGPKGTFKGSVLVRDGKIAEVG